MAETKDEAVKPKARPLIRIGMYIISHSFLVSIVCCTAGVLALLLLPVLAKNTYISENALMPGSASSMLSSDDVSEANKFVNKILSLDSSSINTGIEIPSLIAQHITDLGGEVNYHKFKPQSHKFQPLNFFTNPKPGPTQENLTYSGLNTIGIIRAPRGDGKEAIVLVTPYNTSNITQYEALSLGIGYTIFNLLSKVTWLAKDIIWLASDSKHGEYSSVSSWLNTYHTPEFNENEKFRRGGTMAAALVIKVTENEDALNIYAEASNGQMPNLDLINIVNYMAVHGHNIQGLRVKVEKVGSLVESWWLKKVGSTVEFFGKVVRNLNPKWNFGLSVGEYVDGAATLASSLINQALGVPTGPHGAFRDYQVDSITMEISTHFSSNYKSRNNKFLLRNGRLVEGVIRSINNLLEKFHQSFFLYLLTSPNKFVSVGVYMIAFLLLIAPLPLASASLFSKRAPHFEWLYSAKIVLIMQLWGLTITLIPKFLYLDLSPFSKLLVWAGLSILSFFILQFTFGPNTKKEWALTKSVMISALFIGLCIMSVINFATAEIGALLLVPLCLTVKPLRITSLIQGVFSLILLVLTFPPIAYFVLKGAIQGYDNTSINEFWGFLESLWIWNSATYIYICTVHLPCWALCIYTLLHPC